MRNRLAGPWPHSTNVSVIPTSSGKRHCQQGGYSGRVSQFSGVGCRRGVTCVRALLTDYGQAKWNARSLASHRQDRKHSRCLHEVIRALLVRISCCPGFQEVLCALVFPLSCTNHSRVSGVGVTQEIITSFNCVAMLSLGPHSLFYCTQGCFRRRRRNQDKAVRTQLYAFDFR
jgi:hypothetical protein